MQQQLLIMFLIIGGAAIIPFIARKLRIPSATLEIVYGILLFNTLISEKPEWAAFLKEIGFIYLMFLAGMELDLRQLVRRGRLFWYVVIPLLSLIITPLIIVQAGYPFFLGIAISVLSAGIIIPVLKESELMEKPLSRDIIGVALTGELLAIILLTALDIHHRYGLSMRAGLEGFKLITLLALAALFLRILYVIAWWHPQRVEKVMESEDPVEEGIRAVIAIALAGGLIAYGSGIEPILGSFMAGVIFSHVFKSKGRFEEKINAVGFGFFTPLFFIGVGADFNIHLLTSLRNLTLPLFLALMLLVSNIYPLFFYPLMKLRFQEALGMSLILSAPLFSDE
jgi:Kef-type K+ transport system membrane component KefB